jgi:hypothetical protein
VYHFPGAPRRCCSASATLRALTAPAALVAVVVLVALGQPLAAVAVVVLAVLLAANGMPLPATVRRTLLGRGGPAGSGAA